MKPTCKKCGSSNAVKSGVVAGKQRYQCKECGCKLSVSFASATDKRGSHVKPS